MTLGGVTNERSNRHATALDLLAFCSVVLECDLTGLILEIVGRDLEPCGAGAVPFCVVPRISMYRKAGFHDVSRVRLYAYVRRIVHVEHGEPNGQSRGGMVGVFERDTLFTGQRRIGISILVGSRAGHDYGTRSLRVCVQFDARLEVSQSNSEGNVV